MKQSALGGFNPQAFQKYLKNTGWLLGARVGSLLIKMTITVIALPNYLGASQNGLLNYSLVFITFFIAIAALGMDSYVTRQLLAHPQKGCLILGSAFRLRLISGILVLPVIYACFWMISSFSSSPPATPFSFILIVSFICVFQSVHILDSYFQSQAQGKWIMLVQVGGNLCSALIKGLLIWWEAPLVAFAYALAMDTFILSLGYLFCYRKAGGNLFEWKYDHQTAMVLLKNSLPLAFSASLVVIYMKIGQLMLDYYLGNKIQGVYATVVSISEAWYFVPSAIVMALFPAIMHARTQYRAKFELRMLQLYQLMVVISLAAAIILHFASPWIYGRFFNSEFQSGASALSIQVWAGIFIFLNLANGQYLLAEGHTNILFIRSFIGAIVMIGLNMLWIPVYGMIGAAYATLIAYASSAFFVLFIPKTRKHGWMMLKALTFVPIIQHFRKHNTQ